MGISYFNCDTCGVEMNDCACEIEWWWCSGCDLCACQECVTGSWVLCECGHEYCESCMASGNGCSCGVFECQTLPEGRRAAAPAKRPKARSRRKGR
jgi:hypothetical protein